MGGRDGRWVDAGGRGNNQQIKKTIEMEKNIPRPCGRSAVVVGGDKMLRVVGAIKTGKETIEMGKNVPRKCGRLRWAMGRCWGSWKPSTRKKNDRNTEKRTARMWKVVVGDDKMLGVGGTINDGKKR